MLWVVSLVMLGLVLGYLLVVSLVMLLVMLLVCFNSKPAIAYGLSQHNPPNYPQFPAVNPTLI